MGTTLLVLLLAIVLGGLGFAVHVLWWIALAVLVLSAAAPGLAGQLVLVGIGGIVGGLIGVLGVAANLATARTRIPSGGKALIMIGIGVVAVLVYLVIAAALHEAISQS